MKTISISSKDVTVKPVSLRKAAKSMSAFVKVENGAAEANRGFLKRTAAAFNELLEFHDELNGSKSRRKKSKDSVSEQEARSIGNGRIEGERGVEHKKKRVKKGREEEEEIEAKKVVVGKKRKQLKEGGEEQRGEGSEERRKLKKRRKKNREGDE